MTRSISGLAAALAVLAGNRYTARNTIVAITAAGDAALEGK